MISYQTDPLAIRMAESTPRLFVAITLFMMISGGVVMFSLGREVFAGAPEEPVMVVDEVALKMIMHRNVASTHWPQTYIFVQDEN